MTAIAKAEERAPQAAQQPEAAALFSLIERMATDPTVSLERVEQAFSFYQRVQADQAKRAYYAAFARMQAELPIIEKRGIIKTNERIAGQKTGNQIAMSKYALWEDIVEKIRPILQQNGFALSFRIDQPAPDRVAVTGILMHEAGHSESTTFALPIDMSGAKNNVQGWASSVSYAKRYTACALLNIAARDEDDDGQAAGKTGDETATITEEQQQELSRLIEETGTDIKKFLQVANAEGLWDILSRDYPRLKALLERKKREMRR